MDWLRDPQAIYDESFATIEREAALDQFPAPLRKIVVRMIHACGMVDLTSDIRWHGDVAGSATSALNARRPILCDCEMVRSGIIRRFLPQGFEPTCTLNDPSVPTLAKQMQTTRSAAAVELWKADLEGAIVVIGNAPTTLFHLLEQIKAGAPKPAAIIATPVGFVGAVESKQALSEAKLDIPFVTVLGRRGGSAMASAALNAITIDGEWS
ncbi:precorrin-8X methylmutase [Maritalea porphyrae]|uniref:precorrin-8X methylmutase n=1 Tax=Maritalea porphyrae TaxID=880732 RepID=UPI002F35207C